jgi:hypothetical protein
MPALAASSSCGDSSDAVSSARPHNMSHRLGRTEWVVLTVGLFAALGYWLFTAQAARLQVQLREVRASHTSPFILNGIVFSPDRHLDQSIPVQNSGRSFVFITSDACQFCEGQLPIWKTFIDKARFAPADRVVVVTHDGTRFPEVLAASAGEKGVAVLVRRVITPLGFTHDTGISWTPAFLVLDSGMRIRASSSHLTGVSAVALLEHLGMLSGS